MSLKQEIETWVSALGQYDNHEFEASLRTFDRICDTSKILFNCGMIHATLGQHPQAVECFQRAINRDQYLAVAYFQQGVSNFLTGDFEEALANFNDTLLYLRGNKFIDYDQLGLKYKLYSCEVLFNRGLCYVYLKQKETGLCDLKYASKEKVTPDHDVIDEAIQEGAEEFTVFSIGVGIVYRPNAAKVKNLKTKDYLGKARIIAAADHSHIDCSDAKKAALQAAAGRNPEDRPMESISFAASNLVRPNLHSRSRQQSEPPIHRNVFPPTPPPENENEKHRPPLNTSFTSPASNAASLAALNLQENSGSPISNQDSRHPPVAHPLRPEPLKLSQSSFTSLEHKEHQAPRIGTTRSASERPSQREPLQRDRDRDRDRDRPPPPQTRRLFREINLASPGEADIDEHPDEELYSPESFTNPSPYTQASHRRTQSSFTSNHSSNQRASSRTRQRSRSRAAATRRTQYSIEEEDETTGGAGSAGSSVDEYEILHNAGGGLSQPSEGQMPSAYLPRSTYRPPRAQSERPGGSTSTSTSNSGRQRDRSRPRQPQFRNPLPASVPERMGGGGGGGAAELKNLRIKLHHGDDTRFVMLAPDTPYGPFVDKVREKLKLSVSEAFKVKVRDEEGDLITIGDEDDWELAVQVVRKEWETEAAKAAACGSEEEYAGGMAKMEVWVG